MSYETIKPLRIERFYAKSAVPSELMFKELLHRDRGAMRRAIADAAWEPTLETRETEDAWFARCEAIICTPAEFAKLVSGEVERALRDRNYFGHAIAAYPPKELDL